MFKIFVALIMTAFFGGLFYIGMCVFEGAFPLPDSYDQIMRMVLFAAFVGCYLGQFKKQ